MQLIKAEHFDVSFILIWGKDLDTWSMVFIMGIAAIAAGVQQHFFPPARAWEPMRIPPPAYLFVVLGSVLIGASVIGKVKRWGPLVPTFVIAVLVGWLLMPGSNSRQRDAKTTVMVLVISVAIALIVDFLRSPVKNSGTSHHPTEATERGQGIE